MAHYDYKNCRGAGTVKFTFAGSLPSSLLRPSSMHDSGSASLTAPTEDTPAPQVPDHTAGILSAMPATRPLRCPTRREPRQASVGRMVAAASVCSWSCTRHRTDGRRHTAATHTHTLDTRCPRRAPGERELRGASAQERRSESGGTKVAARCAWES